MKLGELGVNYVGNKLGVVSGESYNKKQDAYINYANSLTSGLGSVAKSIVSTDASQNLLTASLYRGINNAGAFFTGQMSPEEMVQYQKDLFNVSTTSAGGAYGINSVSTKLKTKLDTIVNRSLDDLIDSARKVNVTDDIHKANINNKSVKNETSSSSINKGNIADDVIQGVVKSKIIPEIVDKRLDELVSSIRKDIGKDYPVGNAGVAIVEIEGVTSEIKAFSKTNNSISNPNINHDYSYKFEIKDRIFETKNINSDNIIDGPKAFNRAIDSEAKILEDIAHQLGYNKCAVDATVKGKVYLVTERPHFVLKVVFLYAKK